MKAFLKYGGLALSSMLTVTLFVDLYGATAYGISLALAALALFEGGALAWAALLPHAKQGQRGIVKAAQWFCVVASVVSSGAQIILSTKLWIPGFDVGFVTLLIIVGALAVNVMGVFAYEQLDPQRAEANRELDRQAKARDAARLLEDRVIDQSLIKAESKVAEISGAVSNSLADELRGDVVNYLLAQTRGGDNRRLKAPTTNYNAAPSGTARREPDPAALDEIARYFGDVVPELAEESAMTVKTTKPSKPASKNGHAPKV